MIRNNSIFTFLFCVIALSLTMGCNSLKQMVKMAQKQDLKVEPNPLEVHGGEVNFKISAKLPVKMLKKDTEYKVEAYYVNEGAIEGKEDFKTNAGSFAFMANDYLPESNKEEPRKGGDFNFTYEEGTHDRGELVVVGVARSTKKNKEMRTKAMPVAKGLITTSMLVKDLLDPPYGIGEGNEGTFAFVEHGYTEPEVKQVYVDFIFEQGSSRLLKAEVRDKGAIIDAFVASKNLKEVDGKSTINIKGSHSPEGPETVNRNLATQRAQVMKKYYAEQMEKYNYKEEDLMDNIEFESTTQTLDETLPEFFSLLDASSLSSSQISEVKEIMNGSESFVSKERKLTSLSYYDELMDSIYPQLRYARTDVLQGGIKKTDAEMLSLARQIIKGEAESNDVLSEKELLYAATLTPDMEEKIEIYQAAIRKNDSHEAHNNIAVVQLEKALRSVNSTEQNNLTSSAINHLEMAKRRKETAEVNFNLGLAYMMQGKDDEAKRAIEKAIEIGSNNPVTQRKLNAAEGILLMKAATSAEDSKYTQAVSKFSRAGNSHKVLYNKALANLLHKDYDQAMVGFNEAINAAPNDSWSYYCKAITAARTGNTSVMSSALEKSIQLDSSLRAKALKDLEFMKYFNSSEFKNAVK